MNSIQFSATDGLALLQKLKDLQCNLPSKLARGHTGQFFSIRDSSRMGSAKSLGIN